MRKKWAVRPMELWNPGAAEQWLEHEAAQGWYLVKCNGWYATLERGEAKVCRVRIQPHGPERTEDFEARRDAYAEMGWRFYAVAGRNMDVDFEVYYCDDPAAAELDTDPVAYGWVWEKQLRKAWWSGWLLPVVVAALLVAFFAMLLRNATPLQLLLRMPAPLLFALLVLWPLIMAMSAQQLYLVHGLRRKLKAGFMPEHDGSWRASRLWWRIVTWLLLAYWVLYLCSNVLGILIRPDQKAETAPYVTTTELLPDTRPEDWDWYLEDLRLQGSFLQPLHFRIRRGDEQQRRVINETRHLRFEALAEAVYEAELEEYRANWSDLKETEFDAFDETVLLENSDSGVSVLLVRSGKTVYSLWVNFPANLPGRLESIAQDMDRFQDSLWP